MAVAAVALPLRSAAAPALDPAAPVPPALARVVVVPGDTVWGLARRHAPAGVDVAAYSWRVTEHNAVDARALVPGTVLELPSAP